MPQQQRLHTPQVQARGLIVVGLQGQESAGAASDAQQRPVRHRPGALQGTLCCPAQAGGGGSIFGHQRGWDRCKDCGGSALCENLRIRARDKKDCGGGSVSKRQRARIRCLMMPYGNGNSEHQHRRSENTARGSGGICEHQRTAGARIGSSKLRSPARKAVDLGRVWRARETGCREAGAAGSRGQPEGSAGFQCVVSRIH